MTPDEISAGLLKLQATDTSEHGKAAVADVQQLLPTGIGARAADAYQLLRDKQHAARLQEQKACLPDDALKAERAAIIALWQAAFNHR